MTSWSGNVARLAFLLWAALLAGIGPLSPVTAADGDEAGEDDVGDWILRLFRGIGDDKGTPELREEGGADTDGRPTGGSVGGGDDDGNDDDGGGDDNGGDDGGGDDGGGDDGGRDDGGDDD